MFSQVCVCSGGGESRSSLGFGGGPDPALDGGGPNPALDWGRGPNPTLDRGRSQANLGCRGGTPSPGTPPRIASTCYGYVAGGVPLAFTQEDFLVLSSCVNFTSSGIGASTHSWQQENRLHGYQCNCLHLTTKKWSDDINFPCRCQQARMVRKGLFTRSDPVKVPMKVNIVSMVDGQNGSSTHSASQTARHH